MVPFSEDKLRGSLKRSGTDDATIESIITNLIPRLYEGIPTKIIYRIAFSQLKQRSAAVAARFHLKNAMMELGPSGYPFEKFIGEILKQQGYEVKVSEIVAGKCVNHEIDVIAQKNNDHFMIECKFHNQQGTVCDVKIPLYIYARFKDVEASWIKISGHSAKFHQGWVVTNTRFTSDAIQYGVCAGIKLVGWDYPEENSLKKQIDSSGLYPVTCLTSLTKDEKQKLLEKNIVLCKEIGESEKYLKELKIKSSRIASVLDEVYKLCHKTTESAK